LVSSESPKFARIFGKKVLDDGIGQGEVTAGLCDNGVAGGDTAIGAAVNPASRLEGINKIFGTEILKPDNISKRIADQVSTMMSGRYYCTE
jgi:class 3 adenylate cyclase